MPSLPVIWLQELESNERFVVMSHARGLVTYSGHPASMLRGLNSIACQQFIRAWQKIGGWLRNRTLDP